MDIINRILEDELNRLGALHDFYEKKIIESPRGSLSVKERGKNRYLYLARREDKKVVFEYIGKDVSYVRHALNEQMKQRKEYQTKLREIKENIKDVKRSLRGKRNREGPTALNSS